MINASDHHHHGDGGEHTLKLPAQLHTREVNRGKHPQCSNREQSNIKFAKHRE